MELQPDRDLNRAEYVESDWILPKATEESV